MGNFNVRSIRGYNYILLIYCYDANVILVYPLRSQKVSDLTKTIEEIYSYLTEYGYRQSHQILDNKISTALKISLKIIRLYFN